MYNIAVFFRSYARGWASLVIAGRVLGTLERVADCQEEPAGATFLCGPVHSSHASRRLGEAPPPRGECGPHNGGGVRNVTDRAVSSFWFVDALGTLARLGFKEFGRRVGGGVEVARMAANCLACK